MCSAERQRRRYKLIVIFIVVVVNYAQSAQRGDAGLGVLKVGALNVNGLRSKIDMVKHYLKKYEFDLFVIGESKIRGVADKDIEIPGYSIERTDRTRGSGGGVVIYIRKNSRKTSIYSVTKLPGPLQFVHVQLLSGWDIVGIYLPPKRGKRRANTSKKPPGFEGKVKKVMKAKLQTTTTTTTTQKLTPEEEPFRKSEQLEVLENTLQYFRKRGRENIILLGDVNLDLINKSTIKKVTMRVEKAGFKLLKNQSDPYTFQYKAKNNISGVSYLDHIYVRNEEDVLSFGVYMNEVQLNNGYQNLHHLIYCHVPKIFPDTFDKIYTRPWTNPRG